MQLLAFYKPRCLVCSAFSRVVSISLSVYPYPHRRFHFFLGQAVKSVIGVTRCVQRPVHYMLQRLYSFFGRVVAVGIIHLRTYRTCSVILFDCPVIAVVAYVFDIFLRSAGCIRDRYLCRVLSVFVICVSILQSCLVVNNLFQHARLQAAVFCFEIRVFYYACIARCACFLLFLAEQPAVFVVGVSFPVAVGVLTVLHGLFVVG